MKRFTLILAALAFLAPAALRAAVARPPAGPDFQVSTTSQSSQYGVDVARDIAGNTVYVWVDQAITPQAVVARIFDPAGKPLQFSILVQLDNQPLSPPHVAITPQGEFVVAWSNTHNVFVRRYDRLGRPLGDGFITQQQTADPVGLVDVAIDPTGNIAVVWQVSRFDGEVIFLQRFDAADHAQTQALPVNQNTTNGRGNPRVALGPEGTLLVSWDDFRAGSLPDVWARRYDGPTGTWSQEFRVNESSPGAQQGSAPLLDATGAGAVVYADLSFGRLLVRGISAAGVPDATSTVLLDAGLGDDTPPDAALAPDGTRLVAWEGNDLLIHARYFTPDWQPLAPAFLVSSVQTDAEFQPSVAAGGDGFAVAWTSTGRGLSFPIPVPPPITSGRDGDSLGVFAQRYQFPIACVAGADFLCLGDGRFQATVTWKNPYTGETGTGKALPLTGDTGAFWFFSPNNLELMVKVLDGRSVNGFHWVYYGSLSNVEYTLTIHDNLTSAEKTYHNAPLELASRSDVQAFFTPVIDPPAPAALAKSIPRPEKAAKVSGNCVPSPTTLCLDDYRFRVQVDFTDPRNGVNAPARTVVLTDDTGEFWFFSPDNLELMIKVLDGRGINGAFWVFFGALSDVAYTVTVTDTVTGAQKVYHNPPHHQASVADTRAFPAPAD